VRYPAIAGAAAARRAWLRDLEGSGHELLDGIRERNAHVIADTHGGRGWDNLARNASTSSRSALNRDPITTALREAFTNM
jgi:hypothetical protein